MGWLHVVPLNDLIEHATDAHGADCCPCGVELDIEHELVIHAALDRRECFERVGVEV